MKSQSKRRMKAFREHKRNPPPDRDVFRALVDGKLCLWKHGNTQSEKKPQRFATASY